MGDAASIQPSEQQEAGLRGGTGFIVTLRLSFSSDVWTVVNVFTVSSQEVM